MLAENVANADTPRYRAHDLAPPKFDAPGEAGGAAGVQLATTEPGHLGGLGASSAQFRSETKGNYEIRPTGNAVNMEEEMMKVAANQTHHQAGYCGLHAQSRSSKIALGKK